MLVKELPSVLEGSFVSSEKKRASVAVILRNINNDDHEQPMEARLEDLELCLMLRAKRPGDRWSFQVALVGGKNKEGEADYDACCREVMEEIGLDMTNGDFAYLGRLDDKVILQRRRHLAVCPLVFYQVSKTIPPFQLDPKEVAACGWVKLSHFIQGKPSPIFYDVADSPILGDSVGGKLIKGMSKALRLDRLLFTKIDLPVHPMFFVNEKGETQMVEDPANQDSYLAEAFYCWGLTLGILNEFFVNRTKLRKRKIALETRVFDRYRVEQIYENDVHNLGINMVQRTYRTIAGKEMTYSQYMVTYPVLILLSLTMSGLTLFSRL